MNPVLEAFDLILGLPSWLVQRGHGSFVTLEFGEPTVDVREPYLGRLLIEGGPSKVWRRPAAVHGQWHLWIYDCRWSISLDGVVLADSSSDDLRMARALQWLNGQSLTRVEVDPLVADTTFTFDLGCVFKTTPRDVDPGDAEPAEQWMLYQPDGNVLTVRSDGVYSQHSGSQRPDRARWLPIPRDA